MLIFVALFTTLLVTVTTVSHTAMTDEVERLNFRHSASSIIGQAFRYSPEKAFYIFNQQIYFII